MAWMVRALSKGVLAVVIAASAAPASAQIDFDLRSRIAFGWGDNATGLPGPLVITEPGQYDFELQAGVFNAEGFDNFGIANWIGRITSTEPGLSQPVHPRVAPYNSSIGRDGVVAENGMLIGAGTEGYIDASVGPLSYSYDKPPAPPPPSAHGAEEFVGLYRFSLTITDLSAREIVLSAAPLELSSYTPISAWQVFRHVQPDPDEGIPGLIEYVPILLPPEFGQRMAATTLTVRVIPGAGAGAIVLLGVMGMGRRRR